MSKVKLRLVPVVVFGAEDGYGLSDAVPAWSDCNRAIGKIYRVEDIPDRGYKDQFTVEIEVDEKDMWFFERNWDKNEGEYDEVINSQKEE